MSALILHQRRYLFINSVTSYAYDAADVMDDDNYAAVKASFASTLSLQVTQVYTKKVSGLDHLVLVKKWGISPKKTPNTICNTTEDGVCMVLNSSLGGLGQMIVSYSTGVYLIMCTVINCLPLKCPGEGISDRFLPPILVGHVCSQGN